MKKKSRATNKPPAKAAAKPKPSKAAKKKATPAKGAKEPVPKAAKSAKKQALVKAPPERAAAPRRATRSLPAQPPARGAAQAGMTDEAVVSATGRTWSQWKAALDEAGAAALDHKSIARLLAQRYGVPDWWAQMVTVGYERLSGRREKHQRAAGDYQASKTRVFEAPVERLFDAWNNAREREQWLDDAECTITTSTRPKSVRIAWRDGRTRVDVNLYAKGPARSTMSLQHEKLTNAEEVAEMKAYWEKQFEQLARWLATR